MPTVAQHYGSRRAQGAGTAPVVLMVSGGADSTALLVMACTSALDLADGRGRARIARERIHVLHVNHHLRGAASDADEAFVRELCRAYGLPLCVEHASFEHLGGQNLEAAAREVRYAAARRYVRELSEGAGTPRSAARIATAHTASDRTETFFMNAIKGSGPAGLSSIPRQRNIIVRPLMDTTHDELVRYLEMRGQSWREDESNQDTGYLRNFIRHKLLPVARERNASLERTVSTGCDILGDEDAFMQQLSATALRAAVRRQQEGLIVLDGARLASAELAIARRMVRLAVKLLDPDARLEMRHVEGALACVASGAGSVTLPNGIDARMEFGALALRTVAAKRELAAGWLAVPGQMPTANERMLTAELVRVPKGEDPVAFARERSSADTVFVDVAALGYELAGSWQGEMGASPRELDAMASGIRLWVDAPAPGDVMCPLGMSGRTKKLSDILGAARVPVSERASMPVVRTAPGGSVVWVAGIRLDERFKCTPLSNVLVKLVSRTVLDAR